MFEDLTICWSRTFSPFKGCLYVTLLLLMRQVVP